MFQQPPEMLHMPSAQWDDRNEGRIDQEIERSAKEAERSARITFDEQDEPGEVEFGIGQHGATDELGGLVDACRHLDLLDRRDTSSDHSGNSEPHAD
jgi:hypothetical protein